MSAGLASDGAARRISLSIIYLERRKPFLSNELYREPYAARLRPGGGSSLHIRMRAKAKRALERPNVAPAPVF